MNNINSVYGPWLKVNSVADAVRVSIKAPKPGIVTGYWSDAMKNKIVTKKRGTQLKEGDSVYIYIETVGVPDNTSVTITIKEWDPISLLADEEIKKSTVKIQNNCMHTKFLIDKTWFTKESDLIGEYYFEAESTMGEFQTPDVRYPSKTDDFLYVADKGVLITVLIELPHSKDWDIAGRMGLGGHTAIAIGEEFYDYGPNTAEYKDPNTKDNPHQNIPDNNPKGNNPITGTPGAAWWDQIVKDASSTITQLSDVDLSDVLSMIQTSIKQKVYKVEFTVSNHQAELIEKWWKDRYNNIGKYACIPWSGEQCTTTVRISLEKAGVLKPSLVQTPGGFLDYLKIWAFNTAGPKISKAAKVTQIQWE